MSTRAMVLLWDVYVVNKKTSKGVQFPTGKEADTKLVAAAKPSAYLYHHSDGYPEGGAGGMKARFREFVKAVKKDCTANEWYGGLRFDDGCYLAAKWITFDALENAAMYEYFDKSRAYDKAHEGKVDKRGRKFRYRGKMPKFPTNPLRFLGVGISPCEHVDIEYRYNVYCAGEKNFKVTCEAVHCKDWDKSPIEFEVSKVIDIIGKNVEIEGAIVPKPTAKKKTVVLKSH